MKISRTWATPLTAGAFTLMAVTGVLMFFHLDRGLNHDAHEWLGWVMIAGVGTHITANFSSIKNHLSSTSGRAIIGASLLLLGLIFISPPKEDKGPGWAPPVVALVKLPIKQLAVVANMSENDIRNRLATIYPAAHAVDSIQQLVGNNLRAQVIALNSIFPDEE